MKRILLVEDEKNFARVLSDYLRLNHFDVLLCEDGELAIAAFKSSDFDLCILDIMMPKKDGFTLASEIKALKKNTPLIFLTARTLKTDVIKGYQLGADDYIVKPFDAEVLLLKIHAILNRKQLQQSDEQEFNIGEFSFNGRLRLLSHKNRQEQRLSPKENALLLMLCAHKNDVMPREKALKQIWKDDNYFTGRSMDVYIVKLRKYLEPDKNISIENIHGNGYALRLANH
jgi:two-component system, OmpR family, response regulator